MRAPLDAIAVLVLASTWAWASAARAQPAAGGETTTSAGADEPTPEALRRCLPTFVVSAELGWNALAGVGVQASWRPRSRRWLAVDAGAGLSPNGAKGGLRARWIGDGPLRAQTFGVGVQVAGGEAMEVTEAPWHTVGFLPPIPPFMLFFGAGSTTHVTVGPTAYIQAVWGRQIRTVNGGDLLLLVGWSQVVAGHDVRSSQPLNPDQRSWLDSVTGSGLVLSISVGFGWGGG